MNYNFEDKENRKKQAKAHTEQMAANYAMDIDIAVSNTRVYTGPIKHKPAKPQTIVTENDSVAEVMHYAGKANVAVLNFASYKNPGGMFLQGSRAQEECLCHESFLYNVLKEFDDTYYAENRKNKNKGLYTDRALFTPNVLFARDGKEALCSVITCAAPNNNAAQKYCNVSDEENSKVLRQRIRFILELADEENVETLIAGAFGCGVFGQDPVEVAATFKDEINRLPFRNVERVVFPIPRIPGKSENFEAFRMVFMPKGNDK